MSGIDASRHFRHDFLFFTLSHLPSPCLQSLSSGPPLVPSLRFFFLPEAPKCLIFI